MVKAKKSLWLIGSILLLSLFIVACSSNNVDSNPPETTGPGDTNNTGQTEPSGGDEAAEGGDLVIAIHSNPAGLDPHTVNDVPSGNIAINIYESLVSFDQNNELQGLLATDWEQLEDNLWEFKLREGVKFHDGSDFNAEVVKANYERVLDPDVASQRAFLYEMITEINIIDDYTVQFVTEFPFAPLPAHMAHSGGGMLSLEKIKADYEAMENGENPGSTVTTAPVGTGFFKFEHWTPGEEIKLVRNDDYWGDKAKLDSVTYKIVNEPLTRLSELETGYSHIIEKVQPSDIKRVEDNADLYLDKTQLVSLAYVSFNTTKEPLNDVRVRQAISMAINKEDIVNGIFEGSAVPAVGPIPPGVFGYDESVPPIPYDPEKAKELLAEAGFENGFSTTIWTNDNPQRVQTAEYVQSKLSEIGITVSIEVVEWATYLNDTSAGKHDMFILGWSTPTFDADYALYALFHTNSHGATGNRSFLSDPELDDLLDKGKREGDIDLRKEYYKQAQEKLVDLAPMLYTHHTIELTGVSNKVDGFWVDSNGVYMIQNATLSE